MGTKSFFVVITSEPDGEDPYVDLYEDRMVVDRCLKYADTGQYITVFQVDNVNVHDSDGKAVIDDRTGNPAQQELKL
jgi:hypothetical protein